MHLPAEFRAQHDPYWKSVAVYAVTLILYVIIKALWESTLQQGIVNVVVADPIVVLLGVIVLVSALSLIANIVSKRSIIVSEDGITFISRFHSRTFSLDEIESISIGRDRRVRIRGALSMVKIRIRDRRRALRVRPAVYENEQSLVAALLSLRKHHKAEKTR